MLHRRMANNGCNPLEAAMNQTAALLSQQPAPATVTPAGARLGLFTFLDREHQEIQQMLTGLHDVAESVDMDGLTPEVRRHARALLDWFNGHAREHHLDEELHVFPALLAHGDESTRALTNRLLQDHCWLEEDWLQIAPSLAAVADGFQWFDPDVLRHATQVFIQLYLDHIVLEESVAYPQAHRHIPDGEAARMGQEMARRRALREAAAEADGR